jgi:hypothetical protein
MPLGEQQRRIQQRLKLLLDRRLSGLGCIIRCLGASDQTTQRQDRQNPT